MRKFRLFGIINPFDVLIVAGVVALVYGLNLFAAPQHVLADRGILIRYEIEFHDRHEGFYREVAMGTTVIEGVRGIGIGVVVDAFGSPFFMEAPDEYYNIIRRAAVEGREVTHVVIEAFANFTDYAVEVGAYQLRVGQMIVVRNYSFAGEGVVSAINLQ